MVLLLLLADIPDPPPVVPDPPPVVVENVPNPPPVFLAVQARVFYVRPAACVGRT